MTWKIETSYIFFAILLALAFAATAFLFWRAERFDTYYESRSGLNTLNSEIE